MAYIPVKPSLADIQNFSLTFIVVDSVEVTAAGLAPATYSIAILR